MKLNTFICLLFILFSCQAQTKNPISSNSIINHVKSGNLEAIKKFLETNKDINAYYKFQEFEYTLLCAAVKSGQKEIVMYLVENNANLNKMSNQKTPLMYAAKYGRLPIAQFLLQNGADKQAINPNDKTALDYAHKYKQSELITFLTN